MMVKVETGEDQLDQDVLFQSPQGPQRGLNHLACGWYKVLTDRVPEGNTRPSYEWVEVETCSSFATISPPPLSTLVSQDTRDQRTNSLIRVNSERGGARRGQVLAERAFETGAMGSETEGRTGYFAQSMHPKGES